MAEINKNLINKSEQPDIAKEALNPNMITVDRRKAENFLMVLEECIGDIQEQKTLVDTLVNNKDIELQSFKTETIQKFNNLIEATRELNEKIKASSSYESYLEERIKNANLSREIALLEQQLQKEKAEISEFVIKTDTFIRTEINEIKSKTNELISVDELIKNNLQSFKEEINKEIIKFTEEVEKEISEASDSFVQGTDNKQNFLVAKCNEMLKAYTDKCQQHLETVQKQSIDFLKQCSCENKKLIEKVPAVAEKKLTKKDYIIFGLVALSVVSTMIKMVI